MRYFKLIGKISCGLLVMLPLVSYAATSDLPISYTINSPLVISDTSWKVDVYQAFNLAVARQHQVEEPDLYTRAKSGKVNWSVASTFIAGEQTNERLAKYQNIGRDIWQIRELRHVEEGRLYTNETHDEVEWSVKNLAVSFQRGAEDTSINGVATRHFVVQVSYDKTKIDTEDGEENKTRVTAERHFWFARKYPFSPVQLLPLHMSNNTFVNHGADRLQEAIYSRLEQQMRQQGMLMRTRLTLGGKSYTVEVSNLNGAEEIDLAQIHAMPVIPKSKVGAVVGPMFLSKMLHDAMPDNGEMKISYGDGKEAAPLQVTGKAGFAVMETGDFAVASTFQSAGGINGLLVVLRPVLGMVEKGEYTLAERKESDVLKTLSQKELEEYARGFQVFALVDTGKTVEVYTEAVDGQVVIEASSDDRLSGSFDIQMEVVTVIGGVEERLERVTGRFVAPQGLDARLRSPTSRYLQ